MTEWLREYEAPQLGHSYAPWTDEFADLNELIRLAAQTPDEWLLAEFDREAPRREKRTAFADDDPGDDSGWERQTGANSKKHDLMYGITATGKPEWLVELFRRAGP